jgi:hypothetical protein
MSCHRVVEDAPASSEPRGERRYVEQLTKMPSEFLSYQLVPILKAKEIAHKECTRFHQHRATNRRSQSLGVPAKLKAISTSSTD